MDSTERVIRSVPLGELPSELFEGKEAILLDADTGDVLFESAQGDGYCIIGDVRRPLKGMICVVGTTVEGDDAEPQVTFKWLAEHSDFGTAEGNMYYGETIVRAIQ